jgi:hypothetical protein
MTYRHVKEHYESIYHNCTARRWAEGIGMAIGGLDAMLIQHMQHGDHFIDHVDIITRGALGGLAGAILAGMVTYELIDEHMERRKERNPNSKND